MNLGEKILELRKKSGFSQERLAEKVDVTRQTISNWELGETSPNPNQLKLLSKALNVSIDELLDNEEFISDSEEKENKKKAYGFEYISKKKIKNIPLVHINFGFGHGIKKAKGIIAIGDMARGVVALGMLSMGLFSMGILSLGLISIGVLTLGLLVSMGSISVGALAMGGVAIGLLAMGGVAVGLYSLGGVSVAKFIAAGGLARGFIAIGKDVQGTIVFVKETINPEAIKEAILTYFPNTWNIIIDIFSNVNIG